MKIHQLLILFEDDYVIAINKPTGLLVHRSAIATNTDRYALQELRDQIGQQVHPIHRLDRKTSGVLLFAKEKHVVKDFQEAMRLSSCRKEYHAIVRGYFPEKLLLDHPLMNDKGKVQTAQTDFERITQSELPIPLGRYTTSRYSLIKAFPKTGRMHQIRKHLNHLRHPIIGDRPHGCNKQNKMFLERWNLSEMLLHARSLELYHPFEQYQLRIEAPFFETFRRMKRSLDLGLED